MKLIFDMTHEEVIALTAEDLDAMVLWRCAEEGIPLPGVKPEKPVPPVVVQDLPIYKVGELCFVDRAAAEAVAEAISKVPMHLTKTDYDWATGSQYKTVKPLDSHDIESVTSVKTERVMSRGNYELHKNKLLAFKTAEKTYEEASSNHTKSLEGSKSIRASIYDVHEDAWTKQHRLVVAMQKFAQYLEVAKGDRTVALRFFEKGHPLDDWTRERLFPPGHYPELELGKRQIEAGV